MTIEYPSTPSDDDDIFGRLVKQNWEKEPDLRDTIDAGIRRLLDDAQSAEDAINRAGDVSDEKIQEVLLELNGDWDELGIRDEPLSISGKLRPSAHAIDAEVWDVVEQGGLPGLHTSADDARGKYVPASGFRARVEGFSVEKVPIASVIRCTV